jgi:hypothetical protein
MKDIDGFDVDYVVQYFGTQPVANPFEQYDNANGDLVAVLERLYHFLAFGTSCQGSIQLRTNPDTTVMSVSVSFC